jgi:hypothetical protein
VDQTAKEMATVRHVSRGNFHLDDGWSQDVFCAGQVHLLRTPACTSASNVPTENLVLTVEASVRIVQQDFTRLLLAVEAQVNAYLVPTAAFIVREGLLP